MSKNLVIPAVFLIFLRKDGTFTLLRRHNTGHMDGKLGLPSGKVEEGESPEDAGIREGHEEVGVVIQHRNLELVHVQYHIQKRELGGDYVNFFFLVHHWEGELVNAESHQCSELLEANLFQSDFPSDMIPYIAKVLPQCRSGVLQYSTYSTRM